MAVITLSSHAMFFNGVSDGIVCPQGDFTKTGHKRELYGGVARSSAPVLQDGDGHDLLTLTTKRWISLQLRLGYHRTAVV